MRSATLIGIDLVKLSFHAHVQDKQGHTLLRKKFSRSQLTAFLHVYGVDGGHGALCLSALHGPSHQCIKPSGQAHFSTVHPAVCPKTNKNDFIEAEAICNTMHRRTAGDVRPSPCA